MSAPDPTPTHSSSVRRRRARSPLQRGLRRLWSEWKVEILIALLFAAGVFLLTERMSIRQKLMGWLAQGVRALGLVTRSSREALIRAIHTITLSDAIGLALLLLVVYLVARRARWRLMTMPRFTARQCPRCGSSLHRTRRTRPDRLLNLFVPVRRYRCTNHDCRWRGLRFGRSGEE